MVSIMLAFIALIFLSLAILQFSSNGSYNKSNLISLNNTQIRYKIGMGQSICLHDRVKNLYMIIYPIDSISAKVSIPKINLRRVYRSELSLISDIMELKEEKKLEVYDGEDFIASQK